MKEYLRVLQEEYSDEIPDIVLSGQGKYKVRRNWWNGVVGGLEVMKNRGEIPEELIEEVEDFIIKYTSDAFHHQPLTTQEDLDCVNSLLRKILGEKDVDEEAYDWFEDGHDG